MRLPSLLVQAIKATCLASIVLLTSCGGGGGGLGIDPSGNTATSITVSQPN